MSNRVARSRGPRGRGPAGPRISPRDVVGAAQHARLDRLKTLVGDGADLNAAYRGYRALHALIQEKPHADAAGPSRPQVQVFRWLLAHGADPEQSGAWPPARAILVAAFMGLGEYVEILREHGAAVDGFVAAALADRAAVRRLLTTDPGLATSRDPHGLTALQCAAGSRMGRHDATARGRLLDIATALLDAGAEPNAPTRSWSHDIDAVYLSVQARHLEMFRLLLARGAEATAAVTPALWNAKTEFAAFGAVALAHGADVNRAIASGRPLLNDLIRWGQFGPARWLLEHGADPNRADDAGWTALHQAASRGNVKMVEALLAAGADRGRANGDGHTPFEIARAKPLLNILKRQGL